MSSKIIVAGYIYKITNTKNNKSYIGITTRNLKKRWEQHKVADTYIGRAIRKSGEENFLFEELDKATSLNELVELEKGYIKLFDSLKNGYNQSIGGDFPEALPITLDGVEYETQSIAANHFGLDIKLVRNRISRCRWTIREAYGLDEPPVLHSHEIEVEGTKYKSITTAAKKYNLDHRLVWQRLKLGWTTEQAFNLEASPQTFEFQGKEYASRNEAARSMRIEPYLVNSRVNKGWSLEQAFGIEPPPQSFVFCNKQYNNYADLAKDYKINYSKFSRRFMNKDSLWTLEQALDLDDPPKSIRFNNKLYKGTGELAKAFGMKRQAFQHRLKAGWTLNQACNLEEPPEIIRKGAPIKFTFDEKEYSFFSKNAAALYFGINPGTFKSRLDVMKWSIEEALELVDRVRPEAQGIEYKIDGLTFKSRSAMARYYEINIDKLEARLKRGWNLDRALKER